MKLSMFTPLEETLLDKLLDGNHPVLRALMEQRNSCHVSRRENTGCGFVTDLLVDRAVAAVTLPRKSFRIGDVGATIPGLKHGAGFVLFVRDGYLDVLEGYSFDEPWPSKIDEFSLFYESTQKGRDIAALNLD